MEGHHSTADTVNPAGYNKNSVYFRVVREHLLGNFKRLNIVIIGLLAVHNMEIPVTAVNHVLEPGNALIMAQHQGRTCDDANMGGGSSCNHS